MPSPVFDAILESIRCDRPFASPPVQRDGQSQKSKENCETCAYVACVQTSPRVTQTKPQRKGGEKEKEESDWAIG
jgi:hypothetical protein